MGIEEMPQAQLQGQCFRAASSGRHLIWDCKDTRCKEEEEEEKEEGIPKQNRKENDVETRMFGSKGTTDIL